MKAKIYHNPRCSKSRATLALLAAHDVDLDIVEYLNNPPDISEIKELLRLLNMEPRTLIRAGEAAFKESGLSLDSAPDELIALMGREPIVIERPIVVIGDAARIGRPPERVLELIA